MLHMEKDYNITGLNSTLVLETVRNVFRVEHVSCANRLIPSV